MSRLSIIVPVYNTKQYLNQCIESILGQTFQDFELILVDDGSTDGSGELCDEWEKKDKRIKVIHKANGGLSSAIRTALMAATGEFIGFVDSDDYIKERMFEVLINTIEADSSDCVCCGLVWEGDEDEKVRDFDSDFCFDRREIEEKILKPFFEEKSDLNGYCWGNARWNKLYKRKLLTSESMMRDGFSVDMGEDVVLNLRYLPLCEKVSGISGNCNYFYRVNSESMTHKFHVKIIDQNDAYISDLLKIAREQHRPTAAIDNRSDSIFSMIMYQCIEESTSYQEIAFTVRECVKRIKNVSALVDIVRDANWFIRKSFELIIDGHLSIGTRLAVICVKGCRFISKVFLGNKQRKKT